MTTTQLPTYWTLPAGLADVVAARDRAEHDLKAATAAYRETRTASRNADQTDPDAVTVARAAAIAATRARSTAERNLARAEGRLRDSLREHFPTLAAQTAAAARAATDDYHAAVARLRVEHDTALRNWQEVLTGFEVLRDAAQQHGLLFHDGPQGNPAARFEKVVDRARLDWFADIFDRMSGTENAGAA